MISDQEVRRAAEEVLRELSLEGWQLDVEPALAAPTPSFRQLRLHDDKGKEHVVVVDFLPAEAGGGDSLESYKKVIRPQVQTLVETTSGPRPG